MDARMAVARFLYVSSELEHHGLGEVEHHTTVTGVRLHAAGESDGH